MLKMARHAHAATGSKNLVIAGGVALNSVANGRIIKETPFEDVFIQPAAGDSGGALGAALYAYHVLLNKPREFVMEHAYWGQEYSEAEMKSAIDARGFPYERIDDDEKLLDQVVDRLTHSKVVSWFRGRFEWGPRALGHRSILADPRSIEMKEVVNLKIKFREPFRPFAPVMLEERTHEYFEMPSPEKYYPARYMLLVAPIPEAKRDDIQAVCHVGGTGRLQTIRREWNPGVLSGGGEIRRSDRRAGAAEHVVQPARRTDRDDAAERAQHLRQVGHRRAGDGAVSGEEEIIHNFHDRRRLREPRADSWIAL